MLEELYTSKAIERRTLYAFIMGVSYSIIGIFGALYLFPGNPGLAALAFTSLLIIPTLNKLIAREELRQASEEKLTLKSLWQNHKAIYTTHFFLFLGILITFGIFSVLLPPLATSAFFNEQVQVLDLPRTLLPGAATGGFDVFSIFWNNFTILLICFLASFFYGSGAVFVITWNASVWGVFFGIFARQTAPLARLSPVLFFLLVIFVVFFHMMGEASAYFLTAMSGAVVSKATIHEKLGTKRFNRIIRDAVVIFLISIIVLAISALIEVYVTPHLLAFVGA